MPPPPPLFLTVCVCVWAGSPFSTKREGRSVFPFPHSLTIPLSFSFSSPPFFSVVLSFTFLKHGVLWLPETLHYTTFKKNNNNCLLTRLKELNEVVPGKVSGSFAWWWFALFFFVTSLLLFPYFVSCPFVCILIGCFHFVVNNKKKRKEGVCWLLHLSKGVCVSPSFVSLHCSLHSPLSHFARSTVYTFFVFSLAT